MSVFFFFFFQAEDGIRDLTVTGVQTCALPICARPGPRRADVRLCGAQEGSFFKSLPARGFLDEKRNCKVQATREPPDPRRLPSLDLRQGLQESAGRDGRPQCTSLTCTAIPARRSRSLARGP